MTVDEYRRSNGLHKNETDSEMSKGDHLSVEGGCRYSRRLLGGRPFFGGMYVEDYKRDTTRFKRAVEMNLRESDRADGVRHRTYHQPRLVGTLAAGRQRL